MINWAGVDDAGVRGRDSLETTEHKMPISTKPTNGAPESGGGFVPVCPAVTWLRRSSVAEGAA